MPELLTASPLALFCLHSPPLQRKSFSGSRNHRIGDWNLWQMFLTPTVQSVKLMDLVQSSVRGTLKGNDETE